jgi:hypothetical protein
MIQGWTAEEDGTAHLARHTLLDYLSQQHFRDYEPSLAPPQPFLSRLWDWLMCVQSDPVRKQLFSLIDRIVYYNQSQFHSLYRTAFSSRVRPWLFSEADTSIDDPNFDAVLEAAITRTWFCPVTDSMRINAFYHANRLPTAQYRPDWHSLSRFGDKDKLEQYLGPNKKYERLVLLEDFVGSGNQMSTAARFAGDLASRPPILLVPLLSCVDAAEIGDALALEFPHLVYAPLITFDQTSQVKPEAIAGEPEWQAETRALLLDLHPIVRADNMTLSAFGYRETGALVSMYSNTPNNSVPLLHYDSVTWKALLPRAARV